MLRSPRGCREPSAGAARSRSFRSSAMTRKIPGCSRQAPSRSSRLTEIFSKATSISSPEACANFRRFTRPRPPAKPGSLPPPMAAHTFTRTLGNWRATSTNGAAISPGSKHPAARAFWQPALPASARGIPPTPTTPTPGPAARPTPPVRRSNSRDPLPRCGPPATPPRRSRAISKPDAMRLSAWLPLAVLSALAVSGAATRPHYGGTLRVEMRAAPAALDPAAPDATPLRSLVFETLVRLDVADAPQSCLALSWQHDATARRWQFNLRPGVKFHDGSQLTARAVGEPADAVPIRANHPLPDLLLDLAHNGWLGTGPFRVTALDPGRRATFAANEDYWGGRPFLDAIDVQLGRGLRDQLADLELGKADVVEVGPTDLHRASEHGRTVWSSAPVSLIALAFAPALDPRLREALALSIDRAAMYTVLLQKQGEVSAALLPQWISGYAFAFPTAPDLPRARALANALPPTARTLTLTYDPSMRAARSLAERVAVNARDAGLTVQVSTQNPRADVRLVEVHLRSLDPARALAGIAAALGLQEHAEPAHAADAASPAALYESERKLLEGFRAIPLFQLPILYGAASRVRVYAPPSITRLGDWRFDNVWLFGTAP